MHHGGSKISLTNASAKKNYGVLLPNSGVYFVPDERIVGLLKMINNMIKAAEVVHDYLRSDSMRAIFKKWSLHEQQRQAHNMRIAQENELFGI